MFLLHLRSEIAGLVTGGHDLRVSAILNSVCNSDFVTKLNGVYLWPGPLSKHKPVIYEAIAFSYAGHYQYISNVRFQDHNSDLSALKKLAWVDIGGVFFL